MKKGLLLAGMIMSAVVLTGCNSQTGTGSVDGGAMVEAGDTVSVDYVGTLKEDGSVFDTSLEQVAKDNELFAEGRPYEPLAFTVGARQMIPGFDAGVVGMKIGESKTIEILPADGYGERTEEAIQEVPSEMFVQAGIEPVVGEQIVLNSPMGPLPGTVTAVGSGTTTVDMNHFLAGQTIIFEATIMDITKGTGEIDLAPIEGAPIEEVVAEEGIEEVIQEAVEAAVEAAPVE